jgi:hypothetical protein
VTCVVEGDDGIHFTRPRLGLIEAGGTKDNNVIWRGVESHNFAPFLDPNPAARPDGIHWRNMKPEPVITKPERFS